MDDLLIIGTKIKERRLAQNLRMDDLADKANISRATLWSIEKGMGKCSLSSLLNVLSVLNLSLTINGDINSSHRNRAGRINTSFDKKINRFVIMCVEQYANYINQCSNETYKQMKSSGVIQELINDYEDLHGMSTLYLNEYIDSLIKGDKQ